MAQDEELERFKTALNLAEVAASYGYAVDRKESSRSSIIMRHPDNDKIVVSTRDNGHGTFFSVRTDASGSVVDFVMYRDHCNLGYARKTLRAYSPPSFPIAQYQPIPKPKPIPHDRAALVAQWHRFRPYQGSILEARGLTAATVSIAAPRLRTDERGNVLFRHDDRDGLTGWELKNRGFTGFAAGGRKALFGLRVGGAGAPGMDPPRVVIAESAIDVLSYHQLNPAKALLLSFGGGLSPEQEDLLHDVLTSYPAAAIVAATDNDDQGDSYAAFLTSIRPDAVRARPPIGKDWNDVLAPGQKTP